MSVQEFYKRWNGPPGAERQKGGLYVDIKRTSVHLRIDDTEIQIQDICDLTGDVFETIEISC